MKAFAKHESENFTNVLVRVSENIIENYLVDSEGASSYVGSIEQRGQDWFASDIADLSETIVHTGEFDAEKICKGMSELFVKLEFFEQGETFKLVI